MSLSQEVHQSCRARLLRAASRQPSESLPSQIAKLKLFRILSKNRNPFYQLQATTYFSYCSLPHSTSEYQTTSVLTSDHENKSPKSTSYLLLYHLITTSSHHQTTSACFQLSFNRQNACHIRADTRRLGPPFPRFLELPNKLQMRIFKYAIKDAASTA